MVIADDNKSLKIVDQAGVVGPPIFEYAAGIQSRCWSPDGKMLAVACADGAVQLVLIDGKRVGELKGHKRPVTSVAWSTAGQIASCSDDQTIRIWKPDGTAGPIYTGRAMGRVRWSPDGKLLLASTYNATSLLDAQAQLQGSWFGGLASWSSDGRRWASAGDDGAARIVSSPNGRVEQLLLGHEGDVLDVCWAGPHEVVSIGDDRTLGGWDADSGRPLWTTVLFQSRVSKKSMTFNPDGQIVQAEDDPEKLLVYLVERADGKLDVLTPSEFAKLRVEQPAAGSGQLAARHVDDPAFQQWVKATQALPAEKQIEAVSKKLMELNPGFDGKVTGHDGKGTPKIENGVVTEVGIFHGQRDRYFAGAGVGGIEGS